MESSASPSGASSHATQTGRPSLWTDSDQRKLGRLYVYTTLPIKKILDVIQASSPDGGPGKDSANKKLNAMLDKEPRWLHPRTRTDMERRMNALAHSPTRSIKRELPSPSAAQHYDQSPISPADHNNWDMTPMNGGAQSQAAPYDYDPNLLRIDPPTADQQHVAYSPDTPGHFTDQIVAEPMMEPHPAHHQHPHPPNGLPRHFSNFLRRGTSMTASTERTSTTLKRALSGYSAGFVTHVKRVIKRYTMPVQPGQNNSPVAEHSDTSDSRRDSWVYDEHAPPERTGAPYLPGDYLLIDSLLERQGPCPEGSPEHQSHNCLCRAAAEIRGTRWMAENGPSPYALGLIRNRNASMNDFDHSDVFGNFLMHLLVARDVDHFYILQLVSSNVNCRQRNHAGQTFLHLLNPSWLNDPIAGLGPLTTLLQAFSQDLPFLLARDCYGRTFFHVLLSKTHDPTPLNQLLQSSSFYLLRDAFGSVPGYKSNVAIQPLRRAITSVISEDTPMASYDQPALPTVEPDLVASHARLLEVVRRAQGEPEVEDAYGRNGLHCLAAAILSDASLLRKAGVLKPHNQSQQEDAAANKKRKRESAPPLKHCDSSKDRLTLRETIVNNLLAENVNVNHYDADGNTVLMAFVAQLPEDDDYKVPVSIIQLLIDSGADVNARNRRGETALHIAVRRGRKLAMRTLVQNRANVHVRDGAGRSLLEVADEMVRSGDVGGSNGNKAYMHYEACRAWLSGQGLAVQHPSIIQEWGTPGLAQRR
ncbi:hypothetical protein jhhlp_008113 [Lomentospora prolificans]|uniref:Uncharacterized protein n=1 Tax=Lomentospora prolificans TaxID=41688 RepID=A0A2N3MZK9_9PEZI|nr:hypothetical protein jhhlp_008113 [Lomentospora prolificans]